MPSSRNDVNFLKVFPRTKRRKSRTLEHYSQVCKNLKKVSVTFRLIRRCALGQLEPSALDGKTPAPDGKVN